MFAKSLFTCREDTLISAETKTETETVNFFKSKAVQNSLNKMSLIVDCSGCVVDKITPIFVPPTHIPS